MIESERQTRVWSAIYLLDGMTIVPDYNEPHVWVLPGGRKVTTFQLEQAGAGRSVSLLWPRKNPVAAWTDGRIQQECP